MMRVLGTLVWKELRELLTVRMLVPFVAIMVIFLFIGRAIRGERKKASAPQRALVVTADTGQVVHSIVSRLEQSGLVVSRTDLPVDSAVKRAGQEGFDLVVVLPESIEKRLASFQPVAVEVYSLIRSFSFGGSGRGARVKSALSGVNAELARGQMLRVAPERDAEAVLKPLRSVEYVVLKGRLARGDPELIQGLVIAQIILVPMVLLLVVIYSGQMIAVSIGQEKENKTLETLLTVPVNRVLIVLGKMLGAAIAALVISAVFMGAMAYYTTAFADSSPELRVDPSITAALGLEMKQESVVILGVSLFLAILAALALATLLAVFSEDAKSAQANITPLAMLCLLPYFFTLLLDIQTLSLPLKVLIFAIPFSYPFLVPQALIFGNYRLIVFGLIYTALFALLMVVIAARMFQSDRVLTARLRLRRR
jgi:ABC-2 type transport system permease protein